MKDRLRQLIDVLCGGRQSTFSRQTGIIPQRVTKLLNGDNFGISAVATILRSFPQVDARWLILGEGEMLTAEGRAERLRTTLAIFDMDRYVKYMTEDERMRYSRCLMNNTMPDFTPERMGELQAAWTADQSVKLSIHHNALDRSLCRQTKARK